MPAWRKSHVEETIMMRKNGWSFDSPGFPLRRTIFGVFVVLMVGVITASMLTQEREPEYEGHTLSQWLRADVDPSRAAFGPPSKYEITNAVQHIGSNALPYLIRWLDYHPTTWRACLDTLSHAFPKRLRASFWDRSAIINPELALTGFKILGHEAKSALPDLVRMIQRPRSDFALDCTGLSLAYMGDEGVVALAAVLADLNTPKREHALGWIARADDVGTNIRPCVRPILECTTDKDPSVSKGAWQFIWGRLATKPEILFPVLTNLLQTSSSGGRDTAFLVLTNLREHARPAAPALVNLIKNGDMQTRSAASSVLGVIAPDVLERMLVEKSIPNTGTNNEPTTPIP